MGLRRTERRIGGLREAGLFQDFIDPFGRVGMTARECAGAWRCPPRLARDILAHRLAHDFGHRTVLSEHLRLEQHLELRLEVDRRPLHMFMLT